MSCSRPAALRAPFDVVAHQRLQHVPAEAPRGDDQPLAVLGEEVEVGSGPVVVPGEVRLAAQLDEVLVALVRLRQRGEVVVELRAALGVAAAVVHAASAARALVAALVGHVELGAEDRLDALGPALLVEVEDPVHVPVVGDPQGRLAVGGGGRHDLLDPGGAVEHGVLGVDVEVREAVSHRRPTSSPSSTGHPQGFIHSLWMNYTGVIWTVAPLAPAAAPGGRDGTRGSSGAGGRRCAGTRCGGRRGPPRHRGR